MPIILVSTALGNHYEVTHDPHTVFCQKPFRVADLLERIAERLPPAAP